MIYPFFSLCFFVSCIVYVPFLFNPRIPFTIRIYFFLIEFSTGTYIKYIKYSFTYGLVGKFPSLLKKWLQTSNPKKNIVKFQPYINISWQTSSPRCRPSSSPKCPHGKGWNLLKKTTPMLIGKRALPSTFKNSLFRPVNFLNMFICNQGQCGWPRLMTEWDDGLLSVQPSNCDPFPPIGLEGIEHW